MRRETLADATTAPSCAARLLGAATGDIPVPEERLDADQQNLVLRWLHRRLGQPEIVPLGSDTPVADLAAALSELLAGTQRVEEPDVEAEVVDAGEAFGGEVFDLEEVP